MSDCVVIGIGNTLQLDDGVGVYAVRYMRGKMPEGVELVEGSVYSVDLLPALENRRKVIFIDGIDAGEEPGAVFRFTPEQVRDAGRIMPISLHDFGLYELIMASDLLDQRPREVIVVAVQVKSVESGEGLSEELKAVIPEIHRLIIDEIGYKSGTIPED